MSDTFGDRGDAATHARNYNPGGPVGAAHKIPFASVDHQHDISLEQTGNPTIVYVVYWLAAIVLALVAIALLSAESITLFLITEGVILR